MKNLKRIFKQNLDIWNPIIKIRKMKKKIFANNMLNYTITTKQVNSEQNN